MRNDTTTLVVGATGATGRLLVEQLLNRGQNVRAIVRDASRLSDFLKNHPKLSVVEASILELDDAKIAQHLDGCNAVASCLGHRSIYGHPRRLVTDVAQRLCKVIKENGMDESVRFVLMNTAGNSNRDIDEPISFAQKIVMVLLRLLLPPHVDNENAADYLRTEIGQNEKAVEWVVVRPDDLTNEDAITEYELHPSPTRSAIFNAGKVSRVNVAHFMADLVTENDLWNRWKGQMPVIYNKTRTQSQ